jgi:hypothetical protein
MLLLEFSNNAPDAKMVVLLLQDDDKSIAALEVE